jgi:copper oxidase (laccase) domain-containing protein
MFDLPGYIVARLLAAGAPRTMRLCTYADPERFYSYRRATHLSEPDYGRPSAIAILGSYPCVQALPILRA